MDQTLTGIRFGCEFELILKVPSFPNYNAETWAAFLEPHKQKIIEYENFMLQFGEGHAFSDEQAEKAGALDGEYNASKKIVKSYNTNLRESVAAWICHKWDEFRKFTPSQKLVPLGMVNCVGTGNMKNYEMWSCTLDDAIEIPPEHIGCFAFEFVGPIMEVTQDRRSQVEVMIILSEFFNFLTGKEGIAVEDGRFIEGGCGCEIMDCVISTSTHIHVTPANSATFSPEQAKRMLCSAYFWDPCIRYLLPAWRRVRNMCPDLRTDGITTLPFPERIYREDTFPEKNFPITITDHVLRPVQFLKCTRHDVQKNLEYIENLTELEQIRGIQVQRNCGWNSHNLTGKLATIEFRRGPASTSWYNAICWVELMFSFTLAACNTGTAASLMAIHTPDMAAFQAWLRPYRFDRSLEIWRILDAKFGRARLLDPAQVYICLTDEEEVALVKAREEYKRKREAGESKGSAPASASNLTSQQAMASQVNELTKELVTARGVELAYKKEFALYELQESLDELKRGIIKNMSQPI